MNHASAVPISQAIPENSRPPMRGSYSRPMPTLGHSRITLGRYFMMHGIAALFPVTAGLAFYGWRAGIVIPGVLLTAAGMTFIWRRIGLRGGQLDYAHIMWLALMLALMLPAHLSNNLRMDVDARWPLIPLAGAMLVIFSWLLGGLGLGRVHPVVVTYLLLMVTFGSDLLPQYVLQRNCMVLGNLENAPGMAPAVMPQDPWYRRPLLNGRDALKYNPASANLHAFTTGQVLPDRSWLSLEGLLRDRLPPLEDLILGAHPGPIGTTSGIAVIIGGLFLLYRQLIDYRIPLLIVASAFLVLLVLPIPVVITDRPDWRWIVGRNSNVGWSMGVTFADYEILASPLLFMAFFLATSPAIRPLTRRGRNVYAISVGVLTAVFQLYVSVAFGCYLALMMGSLMTPAMDKWMKPRTLV